LWARASLHGLEATVRLPHTGTAGRGPSVLMRSGARAAPTGAGLHCGADGGPVWQLPHPEAAGPVLGAATA